MSEVNFKSTYRIPITQQGINKTKKIKLKSLIGSYGGIVGTGNTGYACVSIPNSKDNGFLRKLEAIGYKVYQVFEGENIKKNDLSDYVKKMLASHESVSKEMPHAKRLKDNRTNRTKYKYVYANWNKDTQKEQQNRIRQTNEYKELVKKYGEEFAEAVCFFTKKRVIE